jgi:hypothetical protein
MINVTVEELCEQLDAAKRAEDAAKAKRVKLEMLVAEQLECDRDASKTHKLDGWKVGIKRPVNRRLDVKAWDRVKGDVPEELWPVAYKPSLDAKGCKWLAEHEPEVWARCAEAIAESDGKVAVTVTRIEAAEPAEGE